MSTHWIHWICRLKFRRASSIFTTTSEVNQFQINSPLRSSLINIGVVGLLHVAAGGLIDKLSHVRFGTHLKDEKSAFGKRGGGIHAPKRSLLAQDCAHCKQLLSALYREIQISKEIYCKRIGNVIQFLICLL